MSVFRHICPLVSKQKEKMDDTEINNCPMLEGERIKLCSPSVAPSLPWTALPASQCGTTFRAGCWEKKLRGTKLDCSSFPTVTRHWAEPSDCKMHRAGFMSFSPNGSGQVHYSRVIPTAPAFERERQPSPRSLVLLATS